MRSTSQLRFWLSFYGTESRPRRASLALGEGTGTQFPHGPEEDDRDDQDHDGVGDPDRRARLAALSESR